MIPPAPPVPDVADGEPKDTSNTLAVPSQKLGTNGILTDSPIEALESGELSKEATEASPEPKVSIPERTSQESVADNVTRSNTDAKDQAETERLLTPSPSDENPSSPTSTITGNHINGTNKNPTAAPPSQTEEHTDSEVYIGDATWEERTWKELVKLKEDMFWARVGGLR
jgi:hypothetical protein